MTTQAVRRAGAARSLSWLAQIRALSAELAADAVPLLALRGPLLQQRLYGTPVAHPDHVAEVLVHATDLPAVRRRLVGEGWTFPEPGRWAARTGTTSHCSRRGLSLDVRWGLAAGGLPSAFLAPLERALWSRATSAAHGLWEPDLAALVVYLAVHATAEGFGSAASSDLSRAALQVSAWDDVWAVAGAARLVGTVRRGLAVAGGGTDRPAPLLDGWSGWVADRALWGAQGRFVPEQVRSAVAGLAERVRPGAESRCRFAGVDLVVSRDVYAPTSISERLVDLTLEVVAAQSSPTVIDVGTGSGALALAVARSRPDARIHGIDVTPAAVRCARANARRLGLANATFHLGDLLEPVAHLRADAVMTNTPYLPPGVIWDGVTRTMVDGGGFDGLDLPRRLASDAIDLLRPGGNLVFQVANSQWEEFSAALTAMGYDPRLHTERRRGCAVVGRARVAVEEGNG